MNIAIIGGGIVGLALGYKLQCEKNNNIDIFEKEKRIGYHQSGRNSGVLHCGLGYKPGSLKAKLTISGIKQMIDYCKNHQIEYDICGKIIVATSNNDISLIDNLAKTGKKNGLTGLKFLTQHELKEREPFVKSLKTLLVRDEGIIDYRGVINSMSNNIIESGGNIFLSSRIKMLKKINNKIYLDNYSHKGYKYIINCTGLQSDLTYKKFSKEKRKMKIVPFRGEYYKLSKDAEKLVNHLIYPVGNPKFPFLGVHFTRMINGDREVGPNAVLAFKREGYKNSDISISDIIDYLSYPGFLNFIRKNFLFCINELSTSLFKSYFLKKSQVLIPEIRAKDISKGSAGVRAQGIDAKGNLMMDFDVIKSNNQIHVLNSPSPAATSSLAIADYIIKNYIN